MEVKRDILWRVYLSFLGIVVFGIVIIGRAVYIQQAQGPYWIAQAKEQQQRFVEIDAQRGTIFSEDGRMLSTSIPYFDVYIDFMAEGLREKEGRRFKDHLDSLSYGLSVLFRDKSSDAYRQELKNGYKKKTRYYLLKRNITFQQYKKLRSLPLVRQGKDKSGFIAEVKDKRLNPFGLLANRTIGLSREYIDSDGKIKNTNVGLENTYDSLLRGESGKRLMQRIAAGVFVPVDGSEIEPQNGKSIITTIDVNIQDIAENALLRVMTENECTNGTAIVMEVSTGKVKAIANLGRKPDGSYWENLNYAIQATEPGSTFKLATMLSLLEDNRIRLTDNVDLEKGQWKVNGRTVYDSEYHGLNEVTVKEAFMHSSNVGMAKLIMANYVREPLQYINHLKKLHFDTRSGIDLVGENAPVIKTPKSRTWSATTLPWMSFGYEVLVSPLQTLMLYNAIANNGKMMKPYLVNAIQNDGVTVQEIKPTVVEESICTEKTLKLLRECLESACMDSGGTGKALFKDSWYRVAGKTGTALVANGNRGYSDHIYQSSFAGYFPAENPKYTCIVVIKNKPFAPVYYGAKIAGPVFKEIADKLYAMNANNAEPLQLFTSKRDSSKYLYAGAATDMKNVLKGLEWAYKDSVQQEEWGRLYPVNNEAVLYTRAMADSSMPDVRGMGLKDALYLLENMQLKVKTRGKGKVNMQSIPAGTAIAKNKLVTIELN
jgi:cell division protein FtsI (penicillin-binding protein 3)